MSGSSRLFRVFGTACAAFALLGAEAAVAQARDPNNPTCPANPNWSAYREMRFTPQDVNGRRVLLAEGMIDDNLIPRLEAALRDESIQEIWLRSPGGNARVGNLAGRLIRASGLPTRIPPGWACFSACNFLFMGGFARFVDPGGLFIVHMFTHTQGENREVIRSARQEGDDSTISIIGDIEQQSAQLASEDNDFMIRMGLYRTLLTEIMYRVRAVSDEGNHETRRCLTQEELRRYNVVNQSPTAEAPTTPAPPQRPARDPK
jgi:hypothetical protein